MSTIEKRFRRNFIVACILHVAVIGGIVLFEGVLNNASSNVPTAVELVVPADILGDQPKGEGTGRGNYTAPPPEPATEAPAATAGPSEPVAPSPDPIVPKVKAAAPPPEVNDPNEIAIPKPKKQPVKEVKKPADTPGTKAQPTDKPADKSTTTAKKAVASAKTSTTTKSKSTGTAESESSIRNRLASALASAEGGTPGGNNRKAGGGTGESKYGRVGSPNGAADGIAGGVGPGSAFWSYYMHVHDRMYEAWDQPGQSASLDKKMVTTIVLHVARNGQIDGVKLQHSSGNKLMDDSVIAAAHSVPRLDPLPEGLGGDFAEISVNFQLEG